MIQYPINKFCPSHQFTYTFSFCYHALLTDSKGVMGMKSMIILNFGGILLYLGCHATQLTKKYIESAHIFWQAIYNHAVGSLPQGLSCNCAHYMVANTGITRQIGFAMGIPRVRFSCTVPVLGMYLYRPVIHAVSNATHST